MKVRRDISSIPLRTAQQTWTSIINLVTKEDSTDKDQLEKAGGTVQSLIADEFYIEHPMTIAGVSHRLVIYLRYRSDALESGLAVDGLSWNPTAGDWKLYLPCDDENIEWVKESLAKTSPRIVVHRSGEVPFNEDTKNAAASGEMDIDWGAVGA